MKMPNALHAKKSLCCISPENMVQYAQWKSCKQHTYDVVTIKFFLLIFGDSNWWQTIAWILLLAEAADVNALAQGVLRPSLSGYGSYTQPSDWEVGTLPLSYCLPHWATFKKFLICWKNSWFFQEVVRLC